MSARGWGGEGESTGSNDVCVWGGRGAGRRATYSVPRVGRTKACSTRSSCRLQMPKQLCHSDVLFCSWLEAGMGVWGQSLHGSAAPLLLLLCARCAHTTR